MADFNHLPLTAGRALKTLRFIDVLEDADPTKLSWSKIGVALTTLCTAITGLATAIQTAVHTAAATEWKALLAVGGVHLVARGTHEIKRYTETP